MKIEVAKLGSSRLNIKEDIEASLWGMDSPDIKFRNNIGLDCNFLRDGDTIVVEGEIATEKEIICSRCLNSSIQKTKQRFKGVYLLEDIGSELNIDNDLREEILIKFPMKILCSPDCKGLSDYSKGVK